jgi:hypothetical protein
MAIEQKLQSLLKAMRDAISPEDFDQIADTFGAKAGREAQGIAARSREMAERLRAERSAERKGE